MAELLGGLVLIGIGASILGEHMGWVCLALAFFI
jgi:putative Mn2+ efflux pump MntP